MSAFGLFPTAFIGPAIPVGRPVIVGLSGDVAEIGSTVSVLLFEATPSGPISWALNDAPITGATGPSLTVPDADGATLTVTAEGKTSSGRTIRHPAPIAAGQLTDQTFTAGAGLETISIAGDFTFSGTPQYTLRTGPTGVQVDAATGLVQINTDVIQPQAGSSVVIRLADAGDQMRFAESGFSLTIDPAPSPTVWSFAGSTVTAIPDSAGWSFTGATVTTIGDV